MEHLGLERFLKYIIPVRNWKTAAHFITLILKNQLYWLPSWETLHSAHVIFICHLN